MIQCTLRQMMLISVDKNLFYSRVAAFTVATKIAIIISTTKALIANNIGIKNTINKKPLQDKRPPEIKTIASKTKRRKAITPHVKNFFLHLTIILGNMCRKTTLVYVNRHPQNQ